MVRTEGQRGRVYRVDRPPQFNCSQSIRIIFEAKYSKKINVGLGGIEKKTIFSAFNKVR